MNQTDDVILEFLEDLTSDGTRVALPPTAIWMNVNQQMGAIDRAPNTISRRVKKLNEMGLVECIDEERGYYRITDKGLAYLEGELEAEDLRVDDE